MSEHKKDNNANQFAAILFVAILVNLGFFYLPDSILDIQIKKVDLLSDIRIPSKEHGTLIARGHDPLSENGALGVDASAHEQIHAGMDSGVTEVKHLPDSNLISGTESSVNAQNIPSQPADSIKPKTVEFDRTIPDINNTQIEDFTAGHTGLHRFFTALDNIDELGRPVRIAFVGDSFIEGDILVADFRAMMQAQYGGRGVGFLPITSVVAQYRPTIKQSANGWNSYSIINNRSKKYIISGVQFEPSSNNASFKYQMVDFRPGLEEASSLKVYYSKNEKTELILNNNDETLTYELPSSDTMTQFELSGQFTNGTLQFKNAKGLNAIGVAFEDNHGVSVDNFALRGNSGIVMSALDSESCRQLQQIRPYDLIILQYGLNVASDSVRDYSWYRNQMIPVVTHIQHCFPGSDVLILSVSDRSRNVGGAYSTMPAVVALLRAQRQIAQSAEVTFWSIFAAMGGENGMVNYVNRNWASKDYTHLNFNGGREIANVLFDAIMAEKSLFDNHGRPDEHEIITEHEISDDD